MLIRDFMVPMNKTHYLTATLGSADFSRTRNWKIVKVIYIQNVWWN